MSNPTSVIDFADSYAQFLARTNQFGETNQALIQQKFNKTTADGATAPRFPASASTSRTVAQWFNMVDDFILAFMQSGLGPSVAGLPEIRVWTATTANATPDVQALGTCATGEAWDVTFRAWGKKAAKDMVWREIHRRYESDGASLLVVTDSDSGNLYSAGGTLTTASIALTVLGTAISVQFTGEGSTTIEWYGTTEVRKAFT